MSETSASHWQENLALLILRVGLAWFLMVWAINKFLAPNQYAWIWANMHGFDIGAVMSYWIGGVQILVCAAAMIGYRRTISYGLMALMHGFTTLMLWERLIAPFVISDKGFPVNRNASVAIAVLAGFVALWLLRRHDRWSLDHWLANRQHR